MNRYEFENLISDYLDGSMSYNKQKQFEQYMEQDPDAKYLVNNIRNTISDMNELNKLKVSNNFNDNLLSKIKTERMMVDKGKNTLFGFTPFYATVLACLCVALFVVASQLIYVPENSYNDNNSYHFTKNLKENQSVNKENDLPDIKNLTVDSNIDSVKNNENIKKQTNSKKIKFVNY
tara:strand:- start:3991 stop:4521 length:531 start_codon:yes stop_codon:yes gene_type:complete